MLNWDEYGKEELTSPPQPPVTSKSPEDIVEPKVEQKADNKKEEKSSKTIQEIDREKLDSKLHRAKTPKMMEKK